MERHIEIKTNDNKTIYGKLRGPLSKPLIIFVHGLTGHMDEHIHFNGARWFEKHGYSSFRFNLYDEPEDARRLRQCSINTHGRDIDRVIDHFQRKNVNKIFLVGHSLGGPSIYKSERRGVQAIAFWDPAIIPRAFVHKARFDRSMERYVFEWTFEFLLGRRMVNSIKDLNMVEVAQEFETPIKVVVAGDGKMVDEGRQFVEQLDVPAEFAVIQGADHGFDNDKNEEQLFKETYAWFQAHR